MLRQTGGREPAGGPRYVGRGSVLDAVERKSVDLSRVEDAYQWLGLGQIAALLEAVRRDVAAGALDDDDQAEVLEHTADERYQTILPSDEVLYAAFRARLAKEPGAFAGWQRQICLADKEDLLTITCVSAR